MAKDVPPSIDATAFCCPHCGAYTTQYWYRTLHDSLPNNQTPTIWRSEDVATMVEDTPPPGRAETERFFGLLASGQPHLSDGTSGEYGYTLFNVWLSRCYNCSKIAIWVYDQLLYPPMPGGPAPNSDLPNEIAKDYREASTIFSLSPRGAAALLRLCVQKLCMHLGLPGKNIDADIASLVKKGLDPRLQQAFDAVRVTGNNAVHPGKMNVADDPSIAQRLFILVNLIADQMISHPKHVAAAYAAIPDSAKEAIEKRDKPKT